MTCLPSAPIFFENGANNPILKRIVKEKPVESPAVLNEATDDGGRSSRLTILARYIYESRPDLQRVFPDPQGRDEATYIAWLLYYGRYSYSLTEEYLTPLRETLRSIRSNLGPADGVRLALYCNLLRLAIRVSPLTTAVRNARRLRGVPWTRRPANLNSAVSVSTVRSDITAKPFGVNVHGYFRAEMGVGQSARNGIDALTSAGVHFALRNLHAANHSESDSSISGFSPAAPYNTNLYFVNADQTDVVRGPSAKSKGEHNIAFWTWELDELPPRWDGAYDAYDEIWVPSSFCQAAIAARAPIPVVRIPYCVKPLAGKAQGTPGF